MFKSLKDKKCVYGVTICGKPSQHHLPYVSRSVTYHPSQVNAPHLNLGQADR